MIFLSEWYGYFVVACLAGMAAIILYLVYTDKDVDIPDVPESLGDRDWSKHD